MKVSNETKVGVMLVVGLTLLILGFNFLKGNKLFSKEFILKGSYTEISGLTTSNPVTINGMQIGTVSKITPAKDMRNIDVELNITKDIIIPSNSIAIIQPNPISITSVEIKLGNANTYLKSKDVINTEANAGLFDDVLKKVDPVLYEVKKAVGTLDTVLRNVNSVMDDQTKLNLKNTIENLNKATASLALSTASIQGLLNEQTGALSKSMGNMQSVTQNLADNNNKVSSIISNLDSTTYKLAQLELNKTMLKLDETVSEMNKMMATLNSTDGTLGKMLNDPTLYLNFVSTANKLNLLLDDIRVHPKRYLGISLIGGGKKAKADPLTTPLPDTLNAPYIIVSPESKTP